MKVKLPNQSVSTIKDIDIKRLLIANPSLGMGTCKEIIKSLPFKSEDQKKRIYCLLEENLSVFKKKARHLANDSLKERLFKQMNEHIGQWEEEFGEVSLNDMQLLTESTDIKLLDIAWKQDKLTPYSISHLLDEYMVGQEEYKQELGLTFFMHLLRMYKPYLNISKYNLLVYGQTGVGKTFGAKLLADKLGVDYGMLNFERLVAEGIQGAKITDPFTRVLGEDKDNMILIGDEVDKIHEEEIRQELLSILDDKNVISFPTTFGVYREYREIPSKNITCVLCGKFDSITKAVEKRLDAKKIGFSSEKSKEFSIGELYARATLKDLKEVLGSDEICGRIGNFVSVRPLSGDDFVKIMLNKKDSIIERYQSFFSENHVKLEITKGGAEQIASFASLRYGELGVRGLEIVIRQMLKSCMLRVDALKGKRIILDKNYVNSHVKEEMKL